MSIENDENVDWEDLYLRLYAYADKLTKSLSWFRGHKPDSFLKGKQVHDYVSETIEKYLTYPEKYDPLSNRSLINYLKLHIVRTLIGNDVRSLENTTTDSPLITQDCNENDDDDEYYIDSISPLIEPLFDETIDYNTIMQDVEEQLKKDKIAEDIFIGTFGCDLKRREIIQESQMSESEYDNGSRRLNTILLNIAKKYNTKDKAI